MLLRGYGDALRYLSAFTDYERAQRIQLGDSVFRLRRMARLLRAAGDPHRAVPVVHVTGSKGKGATARLVAALARAHGLKVGLYTSPHLVDLRERIELDGRPISRTGFARALGRLLPAILARPADRRLVERVLAGRRARPAALPDRFPTFFEIVTAAAFLHFAAIT